MNGGVLVNRQVVQLLILDFRLGVAVRSGNRGLTWYLHLNSLTNKYLCYPYLILIKAFNIHQNLWLDSVLLSHEDHRPAASTISFIAEFGLLLLLLLQRLKMRRRRHQSVQGQMQY